MRHIFKKIIFIILCLFLQSAIFSLEYQRKNSVYDTLPQVKKGGTLYLQTNSDPKVMNPVLSGDSSSSTVEKYLWMSLMTLDPENLNYLPGLALGYSISEDKKKYTFTLNPNAKWQDNSKVTADDFKFTMDTILNPTVNAAPMRAYFTGISIEILSPTKFVFHVVEPHYDTLLQLALFVPIQKKQFEKSKNFNLDPGILHPIGNGPYVLSKYERGNRIVFQRNKNWWGNELSHYKNQFNMDEVVLKIISDNNLTYEKFIKGDIDAISITQEQWHRKVLGIDKNKFGQSPHDKKQIWALKIENDIPKPYSYIAWNEKNPFFQSVKTRTALSYLVNYKKIIENVFFNLSTQCTSPFGSMSFNSATELRNPDQMIQTNYKKAFDLLKSEGWINGGKGNLVKKINGKMVPFAFQLTVPSQSQNSLKIAQILKEDFKKAGITIEINSLEWNSFLDKVTERREFDATILVWTSTLFPNPKQIWYSASQEVGGSNYINYSNKKVDNLIDKANLEFDEQKRSKILQEINRLIYADQPYTFLLEPKFILEGLNSKIKSPIWVSKYENGAAQDLFYYP